MEITYDSLFATFKESDSQKSFTDWMVERLADLLPRMVDLEKKAEALERLVALRADAEAPPAPSNGSWVITYTSVSPSILPYNNTTGVRYGEDRYGYGPTVPDQPVYGRYSNPPRGTVKK
jgi:hypothetical protein